MKIVGALLLLMLYATSAEEAPSLRGAAEDELDRGPAAFFEAAGIFVDPALGLCAIPAQVDVTNDLLEYLLVAAWGAAHESLLVTSVDVELLNAALLTLGVEPGLNAVWSPKEPPPSEEELRAGVRPYEVEAPSGDGFYLYVAWQEGQETYFYRAEDLVRDLQRGRGMERHRWVYLGSRMVERNDGKASFAAAVEGNLVNIAFFGQGNTLVTAALEACVEQTIWLPNSWLLPPFESPVLFLFSRQRLQTLPEAFLAHLPRVDASVGETSAEEAR
jgi:hypothetical protein